MPSGTPVKDDLNAATGDFRQNSGLSVWIWTSVGLGALLRLVWLGYKSFWLDEIASVVIARLQGTAFWSMLWRAEGNMALYYVVLRPWLHFGWGEGRVRVLSALLGVASIPVIYALGRRLFDEASARMATLFFAVNACAVAVSQEARGYSLLVLGVLVSTYLFVRLIERPSFALACAYGLATGLTFYCHYFGLFIPAAQAISLLALPRGHIPWKQLALAALLIALAAVPVLWMIHIQDIGHITWVDKPSLLELYHLGAYLAAGSGKLAGAVLLALDLALLGLFLKILKTVWREDAADSDLRRWRYTLVASCLFTPIVIVLLVSVVRPIFYHRFLIIALPAWVMMTAAGAEGIRSRPWRLAAIAGVCALSLVSAVTSHWRVKEDWRGVTTYLIAHASPEDRVLYYQPEGYFAVENYRNWLPGGNAPRPTGVGVNPNNRDWQKQLGGAPRAWLVLYRLKPKDSAADAIKVDLSARYKIEWEFPFRAVTIIEFGSE